MADQMHAQMMLVEAAKYDQRLKNSLLPSIPSPGRSESPRSCERATKVNVEVRTSPDRGGRVAAESKPLYVAPEVPKTAIMHHLRDRRIQRTWRQQRTRGGSEAGRPVHVAEAVMIFERGDERDDTSACARCRRGDGVSAECVTVPDIPWACSNCIYDQVTEPCDTGPPGPSEEEEEADFWQKTDEIADRRFIFSLVAQIRQRLGYDDDESPVDRARQIEKAALSIAHLARKVRQEFGQ